jgi:hypothetical protein
MMKMKHNALLNTGVALLVTASIVNAAASDLPKAREFARYDGMLNRSPFAVATAVAPPPTAPNFAKDLYVANAARSPDGDLATVASSTDKNLKLYLTTKEPVDGYSIANIEWSDKVGATKVTITKDGQFATLTFNQALLSVPIASQGMQPQAVQPQPAMPQPMMPQAQSGVPAAGFGQPLPGTPGFNQPNQPIKPAPIPTLPTPPPRVRTVIPRNPSAPPPPQPQQPATPQEAEM